MSTGDVESLDGIVVALYASLSFERGATPDWQRFRRLFTPSALVVRIDPRRAAAHAARTHDDPALEWSIETFGFEDHIERVQGRIDAGHIHSMDERELLRRTEVFGELAHVFSSFERIVGEPGTEQALAVRGINSMQLAKDGTRWWIASIAWTDETSDNPVPARYLPRT